MKSKLENIFLFNGQAYRFTDLDMLKSAIVSKATGEKMMIPYPEAKPVMRICQHFDSKQLGEIGLHHN